MLSPQENLKRATELAFEALCDQPEEQLRWLGAEPAGGAWRLPVLDDAFAVDQRLRRVTVTSGAEAGAAWRILALHYLAIRGRPQRQPPEVTFADLSTARSYAKVYRHRTTARLCATVGRSLESLQAGAAAIGGRTAEGGDAAFEFDVFPRVPMRLVWHAPDEEFPPTATFLLPANIESFFSAEDVVVLSEGLVARLCGRTF